MTFGDRCQRARGQQTLLLGSATISFPYTAELGSYIFFFKYRSPAWRKETQNGISPLVWRATYPKGDRVLFLINPSPVVVENDTMA